MLHLYHYLRNHWIRILSRGEIFQYLYFFVPVSCSQQQAPPLWLSCQQDPEVDRAKDLFASTAKERAAEQRPHPNEWSLFCSDSQATGAVFRVLTAAQC